MAAERAFTNYLPGFNIPMLPRELSDNVCSLRPNERRPALACRVTVAQDGALSDVQFFAARIESKAKLVYDEVSDWLENSGEWQPQSEAIAQQIRLLHRLCRRASNGASSMRWCLKIAPTTASCWVKRRSAGHYRRAAPHRQPHCGRSDDRRQHLRRDGAAREAWLRHL